MIGVQCTLGIRINLDEKECGCIRLLNSKTEKYGENIKIQMEVGNEIYWAYVDAKDFEKAVKNVMNC